MTRILWTQKSAVGPGLRATHAMAYDSVRGQTVLFGGLDDGKELGDTWEWDGQNWTEMANSGPNARIDIAMAFDAERKQTVLFGGELDQLPPVRFGDTWGWDGEAWTQLADIDPGHGQVTRWRTIASANEPCSSAAAPVADTWEWDGAAWTQQADTGPPPRLLHAMAYDSNRGRTVLFGGRGAADVNLTFGDTWEWDGTLWRQVADFGVPPCESPAMAFKNDSVALFGGIILTDPRVIFGNTWTWDGKHWTLTPGHRTRSSRRTRDGVRQQEGPAGSLRGKDDRQF